MVYLLEVKSVPFLSSNNLGILSKEPYHSLCLSPKYLLYSLRMSSIQKAVHW